MLYRLADYRLGEGDKLIFNGYLPANGKVCVVPLEEAGEFEYDVAVRSAEWMNKKWPRSRVILEPVN